MQPRVYHQRSVRVENIENTQGYLQTRSSKGHVAAIYHQRCHHHSRRTFRMSLLQNLLIHTQIALLAIQYRNLHIFEQTVKNFVYSVKLKLEFSILGKLVEIVQENKRSLTNALEDIETCIEKPSPTLHRTLSPRSHSNPFTLAEKTLPQHIEHRDDTSDVITPMHAPNGFISEPVRMRTHSQDSLGTQARRRGARESDIDYAEIVRSLS